MNRFDGKWYGHSDGKLRGTIKGNVITWYNGQSSRVTYDDKLNISLTWSGKLYRGALHSGTISWDNGDIWTTAFLGIERIRRI